MPAAEMHALRQWLNICSAGRCVIDDGADFAARAAAYCLFGRGFMAVHQIADRCASDGVLMISRRSRWRPRRVIDGQPCSRPSRLRSIDPVVKEVIGGKAAPISANYLIISIGDNAGRRFILTQ